MAMIDLFFCDTILYLCESNIVPEYIWSLAVHYNLGGSLINHKVVIYALEIVC